MKYGVVSWASQPFKWSQHQLVFVSGGAQGLVTTYGCEETKYGGFLTLILYSLRAGVRSFYGEGIAFVLRIQTNKTSAYASILVVKATWLSQLVGAERDRVD